MKYSNNLKNFRFLRLEPLSRISVCVGLSLRARIRASVLVFLLLCVCDSFGQGIEPTYSKVLYGPHEANYVNVWLASAKEPTPVLLKIHGGGWIGGKPEDVLETDYYLKNGVSVVSVGYRLADDAILPAPVLDVARALQFVRSKAEEWNMDKTRVALLGGSAGGCTSLFLALHEDLADPESDDPVLRESTKPLCVGASNAQSTIDPFTIQEWFGGPMEHPMIWRAVGAPNLKTAMDRYEEYQSLYKGFSPINFVNERGSPVYLNYSQALSSPPTNPSEGIHHPMFGAKLKEAMDAAGVECIFQTKDIPDTVHGGVHKFILHKLTHSTSPVSE